MGRPAEGAGCDGVVGLVDFVVTVDVETDSAERGLVGDLGRGGLHHDGLVEVTIGPDGPASPPFRRARRHRSGAHGRRAR